MHITAIETNAPAPSIAITLLFNRSFNNDPLWTKRKWATARRITNTYTHVKLERKMALSWLRIYRGLNPTPNNSVPST
ncbi:hypothetical protein EGYY_16510 [Eggerthella sp. YY7918]|nr:hypothetical protein EGYY_16510 [Eggerthella sp. YY7918]